MQQLLHFLLFTIFQQSWCSIAALKMIRKWRVITLAVARHRGSLIRPKKTGVKMSIKAGGRVIKSLRLAAYWSRSKLCVSLSPSTIAVHFLHFTSHSFTFCRSKRRENEWHLCVTVTSCLFVLHWPRVKKSGEWWQRIVFLPSIFKNIFINVLVRNWWGRAPQRDPTRFSCAPQSALLQSQEHEMLVRNIRHGSIRVRLECGYSPVQIICHHGVTLECRLGPCLL